MANYFCTAKHHKALNSMLWASAMILRLAACYDQDLAAESGVHAVQTTQFFR